ncbi:hypothetical protein J4Q44_G00257490 [Coregonus suidteri]|uniref:Uncharacterized protein n=1 Tax=Coregonus suidteri TaxID=861788 RepID=A0AAN8LCA5_9TELE
MGSNVCESRQEKASESDTSQPEKQPRPLKGKPQIMRKTNPSVSRRLPAMTKLPVLPGVAFTLSRANLGKKLYQPMSDFNLNDPNCHVMRPTYNSLHDPNLNEYYHQKEIHGKLKKRNLITEDDNVVCSLKEYNTYKQYLDTVKTNHDKTYSKRMKEQMLRMVRLQEEGHIPKDVTLEDMREYLLEEGALNLKHLQSTIGSRARGQKDGLQTALYDPEREFEEDWVSKERSRLKLIENYVKHDVNKARYLKEAKEKRNRKKICIMEQKQAIQMRKMEEELKNLQVFERLREATIKPNKLLEGISLKPAPVQPARLPAHSKTVTKSFSVRSKPSVEKDIKTEQGQDRAPDSHTVTERELGSATSDGSLKPRSKAPVVPKSSQSEQGVPSTRKQVRKNRRKERKGLQAPVLRISKAIERRGIADSAQLKSVILDHLGSKPVRKQLAESIRDEVKVTIPGSKPAAQRARSARIAYDVLKCVSRAANLCNKPACRLRGGNPIKPNAKGNNLEPEEQMANGEDMNLYVTTLITDVLEELKEQVIVMIREDSPTQFKVVSAKASQTAIDVVSNVLEDVRDLLNEGNIEELALDGDDEEGTSGLPDSQPPAMTASEMADPENRPVSCSKQKEVAENDLKTSNSEASAVASASTQETDTTTTVECNEETVENDGVLDQISTELFK